VAGAGGIHAEAMASGGVGVASVWSPPAGGVASVADRSTATALATRSQRGLPPRFDPGALADVVERVSRAGDLMPHDIREFEINPLVIHGGTPVALDVLVTVGDGERPAPAPRPVEKLQNLLVPERIAVAGVSRRRNPGRVILENLIRGGFPRESIHVIKPGTDEIDGCVCVPDVASLPRPVDVLVLSVDAERSADALIQAIEHQRAESVILIPGGLEEKDGGAGVSGRMRDALEASRNTDWKGPLVNGGNCLGVISEPGRYDTMFIPAAKQGSAPRRGAPVAMISQSGAFVVSKGSKLAGIARRYVISIGNQMDVTIGDYLAHLQSDVNVRVFAVYVEGFRPLDGHRFLEAARRITAGGRQVIMYAAGRTRAGAAASASHTAAVAGDYAVTRAVAEDAGVIVAESLEDFEDLVALASLLAGRKPGRRVGAVSNAGFECVAIADHIGGFELSGFAEATRKRIGAVLERAGLASIVGVANPQDLTPILGDADYAEVVEAIAQDPGVDTVVVGCVPLTPALQTLPSGEGIDEDVASAEGIASRLVDIAYASKKPLVAVVDAGAHYDAMVGVLAQGGVPVFRTIDRAMRLLDRLHSPCQGHHPDDN
jgi:acyl-CoA synthetase (NDP forming)